MTQPDSIPAEWIRAAALAICKVGAGPDGSDLCEKACQLCTHEATAAITILRPLIEAETRERCAVIAEKFAQTSEETMFRLPDSYSRDRIESRMLEARSIASALRAEGK